MDDDLHVRKTFRKRFRLLHLKPKAHPLLERIFAIGATTRAEAFERVTQEDRDRFFAILSTLKTNLLVKAGSAVTERSERSLSNG